MRIVHVRLVDKTSFIAHLVSENETEYVFSEPMYLEEKLDANGNVVTVLTKWVYFEANQIVKIKKNHVILCCRLHPTFENYYEVSKVYYTIFIEQNIFDNVKNITDSLEQTMTNEAIKINLNKSIH